jgi:hypothetical protein
MIFTGQADSGKFFSVLPLLQMISFRVPAVLVALGCSLLLSPASRALTLFGNGGTGFGGAVGGGNLVLSDDGTNLNLQFNRGAGSFTDNLVIYIDSVTGGFGSSSNFTDTGDAGRIAISGFNGSNRTLATFASGFGADYAINLDNSFAGLFSVSINNPHIFVNPIGLGLSGNTTAPTYSMSLLLSNIGITPGESFQLVASYISGSAFRSDETFVTPSSLTAGFGGNVTWSTSASYTTIPEPSSAALLLGAGLLALARRRGVDRPRPRSAPRH